jgi:hypothetical protein
MRLGVAVILVLALGVTGCGAGSSDGSDRNNQPHIFIAGSKSGRYRNSEFVTCLKNAGWRVTIDDSPEASIAETYFYDFDGPEGGRTTEQAEQYQKCSEKLVGVLRERVNELGFAEPEIQRLGKDQISIGLPGVKSRSQESPGQKDRSP